MIEYLFDTIYKALVSNGLSQAFDVYKVFLFSYVNPLLGSVVALMCIVATLVSIFKEGVNIKAVFAQNAQLLAMFVLVTTVLNSIPLANAFAIWVIDMFEALSKSVFSAISGSKSSEGGYITELSKTIDGVIDLDFGNGFLDSILGGLKTVVVAIIGAVVGVMLVGKVLIIKVVTYILISLLPLALALAIFPQTRPMTVSWIKLFISYNMQLVVISLITAITLSPITQQLDDGEVTAGFFTVCVSMILFGYFLSLVNSITDGLVGTIGTASGNFSSYALNMAAGGVGMAAGGIGMAASGAKAGASMAKSGVSMAKAGTDMARSGAKSALEYFTLPDKPR